MTGVLGVGIDVADVARFARLADSEGFVRRWFTPDEGRRCLGRADRGLALASCWAVKEAVWKAIGPDGWDGPLPWRDIAVLEPRHGAYVVVLSGRPASMTHGLAAVSVAVLRHRQVALATCLLIT